MSGLNSNYISALSLEPLFVSAQTGQLLAGGKVYFYVDTNRLQAKPVYELVQGSGNPPNYTYQPLPNPVTLSGVGTIQDAGGNNVALYYFPFDQFGNQELYYIEVWDSGGKPLGNLQFTREAWPFPNGSSGGANGNSLVGLTNQITNPQFSQVLFNPSTGISITYSGAGTNTTAIAPGWSIAFTYIGAGTVTVNQTPVSGTSLYPYNPPYVLTINASANVTSLQLIQRFSQNTDWAAPQVALTNGFLSAGILLAPNTNVQMQYISSAGNAPQTLLTQNNTTAVYQQYFNTIELEPAANTSTPPNSYDQLVINLLNTVGTSVIGNVQLIPVGTNVSLNQFDQTTINRQIDQSFNYYNPLLQYKPIPSYLVGWDFPKNPAQYLANGALAAQAFGANKSYYAWDQTILYQSVNNAITVSRGSNGELVLTAAATGQMAIIQYLTGKQVNEILNSRLSVNVEAKTSKLSGYSATVSLWYGTGTLPSCIASNLSIVAMLNPTGYPISFNQPTGMGAVNWAPIPRSGLGLVAGATGGGDAQFTIAPSSTTNFNEYQFSGWDLKGATTTQTGTLFAIVLGTASITSGDSISINSISLVPGDIATRPASQSPDEVLRECQYYYEMSFVPGTVPVQSIGLNTGENRFLQIPGTATATATSTIPYKVTKVATPTTITLYNPAAANAQIRDITTGADTTAAAIGASSVNGFNITYTTAGGSSAADVNGVHWTSDARLAQ